jgi:hypothetical protein
VPQDGLPPAAAGQQQPGSATSGGDGDGGGSAAPAEAFSPHHVPQHQQQGFMAAPQLASGYW